MIDPALGSGPDSNPEGDSGGTSADIPADEADVSKGKRPPDSSVVVRYGLMDYIGEFRKKPGVKVSPGMKVVVRTKRGVEMGEVVCGIGCDNDCCRPRDVDRKKIQEYLRTYEHKGTYSRGGKLLRPANQQDIIDYRHLEQTALEAGKFCRNKIDELNLPMRLVKVEHLLGGEKILFHFSSESRVDFRELVHQLASRFRTRIEMHQVGARDEAHLVADYERCGRPCCCKSFLKELKPVSMKMAKIQKATLDPAKISGRCGRLMCCLRYEDEAYMELRKKLPKRNSWVRTEEFTGRVIDTQIITQFVKIWKPDNTTEIITVDDIVERDLPDPGREADKQESKSTRTEEHAAKTTSSKDNIQKAEVQPENKDQGKKDQNTGQKSNSNKKNSGRRRRNRRNRNRKPSPGKDNQNNRQGAKAGNNPGE